MPSSRIQGAQQRRTRRIVGGHPRNGQDASPGNQNIAPMPRCSTSSNQSTPPIQDLLDGRRWAAVLIVALLLALVPSRGEVNLLSPKNGGTLLLAPDASWQKIVDGDDDPGCKVGINEAVFGFKDDRSAPTLRCRTASSRPIANWTLRVGKSFVTPWKSFI